MNFTHHWGQSLGYQQITGLSTVKSLTVPQGACIAVIGCDTQNVRWRDDTTDPTSTIGMLIRTTDQPFIYAGNLGKIEFIEVAASAVLNVAYYGFAPLSN